MPAVTRSGAVQAGSPGPPSARPSPEPPPAAQPRSGGELHIYCCGVGKQRPVSHPRPKHADRSAWAVAVGPKPSPGYVLNSDDLDSTDLFYDHVITDCKHDDFIHAYSPSPDQATTTALYHACMWLRHGHRQLA